VAARPAALGGLRPYARADTRATDRDDGSGVLAAVRAVRAIRAVRRARRSGRALAPFLEAGCRHFNFVPEADSLEAAIEAVAEVKTLLSTTHS